MIWVYSNHWRYITLEMENLKRKVPELFLYGSSEDLSEIYFESLSSELFIYKNNSLVIERKLE